MTALFLKEIRSFLGSLIGYIVMSVFLLLMGLFMWVFPGDMNVLDAGYADIDTLFLIAPWVFMFLIPAITMRSFSEEKRTGTIELLMTKPISSLQIILAKYFAGLLLVIITILPTLVYFFTVGTLGAPQWNIDIGGTLGSYIGLIFLAASYVSIGIFASSLTSNQIVAFLLSSIICFFMYIGFESISSFDLMGSLDSFFLKLGISNHYQSMSRGLIDTRDVLYFIGLIAIFTILTKLKLTSEKW